MRADYPVRKSPRLKEYNYNENGAYFVTFCTKNRSCILASVAVGAVALDGPQICLTQQGKTVEKYILRSNEVYTHISVDTFVIMPNHVHLLVTIVGDGPSGATAPTAVLPRFVGTLKRLVNRELGENIWQRSFHEHIVRNEKDYLDIWAYIVNNPARWAEDRYFSL